MADSSLTQLSEAEHLDQASTIKQNFLEYLIQHSSDMQTIIIEQKKRLPFVTEENEEAHVHIVEFTRNTENGRYGFLTGVYNPEDK